MSSSLQIDKVYVLSVRSFTQRIAHIQRILPEHGISFDFIFEHDIPNIKKSDLERYFPEQSILDTAQKSLVLKHMEAWRRCVNNGYQRILVLEDDVVLHPDFNRKLNTALNEFDKLNPGFLLFLGGADTRVPKDYFLEQKAIFKLPIATADGYITDIEACRRRLNWLEEQKINLPADHLLKQIDQQCSTAQYWTTTPIVEQGSVFGLFESTLDVGRKKNSNTYNLLRYRWKIFQRRTLPGFIFRTLRQLKLL